MLYLDSAATKPVRREVLEAMWPYLTGEFGNPSSVHGVGRPAALALAAARAEVAEFLGCRPAEVTFTSGGTEANNLAIKGIALASPRGRHIVTSAIEHPSVLEVCDYLERLHAFEITRLPVDGDGLVSPDEFARSLRDDTTLCSIMVANNEVGTVQPVEVLAGIARERGIPFHADAVQAAGAIDLRGLGVDALSISGHKLGASKGIGALFVRGRLPLEPLLHGGGQERGRRSGTENVAFAVGLAAAVGLSMESRGATDDLLATRDALIDGVVAGLRDRAAVVVTGSRESRLPGHASFCFPGTSGEAVLLELESRGIICSSGSACAAGSGEPSAVLLALGIEPAVAQTAVRFTLGDEITSDLVPGIVRDVIDSVAAVASLGGSVGR